MTIKRQKGKKIDVSLFRFVTFIFLCSIIFIISIFSYFANKNIDLSTITFKEFYNILRNGDMNQSNTEVLSEMYFDSGGNVEYSVYRDYIIEASKYGLRFLDKNFKEHYFESFGMNNPRIRIAGLYITIADIGGKDIYLFNGSQKIWSKRIENNILSVDVSSKGFVLVVHEEKRYKTAISMFELSGDEVFTMGKAENYISMAKFSHSGFVINQLNTSNIKIKSFLEFSDTFGRFGESQITLQDTIVTNFGFLNNDYFVVLGDKGLRIFDKNKKEKNFFPNTGRFLGGNIVDNKYIAVACSEEEQSHTYNNNKARINIFNNNEKVGDFLLTNQVKNIVSEKETIALNTGKSVTFINVDGKYLGKFDCKQEANQIEFFDDSNLIIVEKSILHIINILS
jgi:hypothetical protein